MAGWVKYWQMRFVLPNLSEFPLPEFCTIWYQLNTHWSLELLFPLTESYTLYHCINIAKIITLALVANRYGSHYYHICSQPQCISESTLKEEFNHVAEELGLMDANQSSCYQLRTNDSDDIEDTNCSVVYSVCRDLILETGLTTKDCLAGNASSGSRDHKDDVNDNNDDDDDISASEGYPLIVHYYNMMLYLQLMVMDFYQPS